MVNLENQKYDTPWEHPDIAGIVSIFNGKVVEIKHKNMITRDSKEDIDGQGWKLQG